MTTDADRRSAPWPPSLRLRPVLLGALLVLLLCLLWAGVVLLQVRSDLTSAQDALQELSADRTSVGGARDAVGGAREDLAHAAGRLRQPGPRLVAHLPYLGRAVRGPAAVADTGLAVVTTAERALAVVDGGDLLVDGTLQLPRLRELQEVLSDGAARSREPAARLAAVRVSGMPGPLVSGVEQARADLVPAADRLRTAADGLAALGGVLGADGDRKIAVVLLNNAEQRGGGGLVSVFATGTTSQGRLSLASFEDVFDVADTPAAARRVPSPPDYHALWGPYLADTTLWRNVAMSPDGPSTLGVAAGVVGATTGTAPDAVVSLDVRAIAAVLAATGPLTLPDGTPLSADNAVDQLLLQAYTKYPDDARGQAARRATLRGAADAVVAALLEGRADVVDLARSLRGAAAGRHLAVWSGRPQEQEQLRSAGLSGALAADGGDLVSVATQNFGQAADEGNKLDFFVRRLQQVEVVVGRDHADVTRTFALRNTAPSRGLPGYVLGYTDPGRLGALVTQSLPRTAQGVRLSRNGAPLVVSPAPQTDHVVVSDTLRVAPGATVTWVLRYRLPLVDGHYGLTAVPQPLAVDAGLGVTVRAASGLRLVGRGSTALTDGEVSLAHPFTALTTLDVQAVRPPALTRAKRALRRFWDEPVRLP